MKLKQIQQVLKEAGYFYVYDNDFYARTENNIGNHLLTKMREKLKNEKATNHLCH